MKAFERKKLEDKGEILKAVVIEKKNLLLEVNELIKLVGEKQERIVHSSRTVQVLLLPQVKCFDSSILSASELLAELQLRDKQLSESEEDLKQILLVLDKKQRDEILLRSKEFRAERERIKTLNHQINLIDKQIDTLKGKLDGCEFEIKKYEDEQLNRVQAKQNLDKELKELETRRILMNEKYRHRQEDLKEKVRSLSRGEQPKCVRVKVENGPGADHFLVVSYVNKKDEAKIEMTHESGQSVTYNKEVVTDEFNPHDTNHYSTYRTHPKIRNSPENDIEKIIDNMQVVTTVKNTDIKPQQTDKNSSLLVHGIKHLDLVETRQNSISQKKSYSNSFRFKQKMSKQLCSSREVKEFELKPSETNTFVASMNSNDNNKNNVEQMNHRSLLCSKRNKRVAPSKFNTAVSFIQSNIHSRSQDNINEINEKQGQLIKQKKREMKTSGRGSLDNKTDFSLSSYRDPNLVTSRHKPSQNFNGALHSSIDMPNNKKELEQQETKFESFFTKNLFRKMVTLRTNDKKESLKQKENIEPALLKTRTSQTTRNSFNEIPKKSVLLEKAYNNLFQKNQKTLKESLDSSKDRTGFKDSVLQAHTNRFVFQKCADQDNCKKHSKYFRLESDCTSLEEMEIFQAIRPLLEGTHIYKKFTSSSVRKSNFDPRNCLQNPPEQCGYGLRFMRLNISKRCLEVLTIQKASIERTICISNILKVSTAQYDQLVREGATSVELLPFELLSRDGPLDLISLTSSDYRAWVKGLTILHTNMRDVCKLSSKIKMFCV